MSVIECKDLKKRYTNFELTDVNFSIKQGRVVGLIGENGAGKTTLINLILNKIHKDNGEITVFGKELLKNEIEIKNDIGAVLDECHLPGLLNTREIEMFMSKLYVNWNHEEFEYYLNIFGLPNNVSLNNFSRGMKRKTDLAIALSHDARLFIFDELTSGMDIMAKEQVMDILQKTTKKDNRTILFSTHSIEEVKTIVDDIILMHRGKIVTMATKNDLEDNYSIIEVNEREYKEISKKYRISSWLNENGKVRILLNNKKNTVGYGTYNIRKADLKEVILMKLKGEYDEGTNHEGFAKSKTLF